MHADLYTQKHEETRRDAGCPLYGLYIDVGYHTRRMHRLPPGFTLEFAMIELPCARSTTCTACRTNDPQAAQFTLPQYRSLLSDAHTPKYTWRFEAIVWALMAPCSPGSLGRRTTSRIRNSARAAKVAGLPADCGRSSSRTTPAWHCQVKSVTGLPLLTLHWELVN